MARNPDKRRCKAKNRKGEQCKNWAKPGWEVCHYHGAGGGAPPGNKNAVKTGEYETILLDALDDDERVLFHAVDTDVLKQIDEELRLITIRERRMLQRLNGLRSSGDQFGMFELIQAIDDALTRVQDKKARLLELKHKVKVEEEKSW